MIFYSDNIISQARTQMRAFLNLRPIPPFQAWKNIAARWAEEGMLNDASFLLDFAAKHYQADLIRSASDQILPIPSALRGRPITRNIAPNIHPAIFALRDHTRPIPLKNSIGLRAGNNLLLCNPTCADIHLAHIFSDIPSQAPSNEITPYTQNPIAYIGIDQFVLFSQNQPELKCVNLSALDWTLSEEEAEQRHLPSAWIQFPGNVHQICGPLQDGTFFVTCLPKIPILSDICILCQLDFDIIREYQQKHPGENVDLQTIQAIKRFQILPNIEQSLVGDTCATGDFYMTCGGGIQRREIRFIYSDGSWTTKFSHEAPVIRIIQTESGLVSLDKDGQAFLWSGTKITDDYKFDLTLLPEPFNPIEDSVDITLDWHHHRLFLTHTPNLVDPYLSKSLAQSYAVCLDSHGVTEQQFVKKIYPMKDTSLAMLSDGHYYFWNHIWDCIEPVWQLSQRLAVREDWMSVLNTTQIPSSLESDPRIRMIKQ